MLKQKSNLLFEKFNESASSDKNIFLNTYKKDIGINEDINYQVMKEMATNHNSTKVDEDIKKLIEPYINALSKNGSKIENISKNKDSDYKIINKLSRELPNNYYSNEKGPIHHINKYPDLVLRAGQFS